MSRRWLLSLFCLFCLIASLLFVQLTNATATLQVNESTTRILLEEEQTLVSLVVSNPLGDNAEAGIKLELIDPDNVVRAVAHETAFIKPGTHALLVPFSNFSLKHSKDFDLFVWYRLRYSIAPIQSGVDPFAETHGVIAVGEIAPEIFRLQVTAPSSVRPGLPFRVRVRTVHPITSLPLKDTRITAEFEFEQDGADDISLKKSAQTAADGYATFDFTPPRVLKTDEGNLSIAGERGVVKEEVHSNIDVEQRAFGMLNTDKSLYQPGQTLHVRLMVFDYSRHALANEDVTVKIVDPEGETVFTSTLKTSRFGIASTDWVIPENTRLGDYRLESEVDDSTYEDSVAVGQIKISRYELPNFSVNIKPDRSYYLPGSDSNVEVRAEYLFGQPVKRGHVRVVRETERRWDYREQKWETEEGEVYEGDTDDVGRFVARIKLTEEHEKLAAEDYSRFHDLSYAAYFTDPTTNRTEQRRFDLRLTKDPIHVYVIEGSTSQARDYPMQFYVSTSYADGSPAECDVSINGDVEALNGRVQRNLRTIRTNKLGLAKVTDLPVPQGMASESSVLLKFVARDAQANSGKHAEDFYYADSSIIRLSTDKMLYRAGDPVRVQIASDSPDMLLVLDASHGGRVIRSELVQLTQGSASVVLPFTKEFKNEITISAYSVSETKLDDYHTPFTVHTILFPHDNSLHLDAVLSQATYRPGEEASVSFLSRLADGNSSISALGVVVFDKAVEERARTDNEFGGPYGFYDPSFFSRSPTQSVAGITKKDLEQLDLNRPLPEGISLAADVILNTNSYEVRPRFLLSNDYETDAPDVFASFLKEQLTPLKAALDDAYANEGVYPTDEAMLKRLLYTVEIPLEEILDPWGLHYQAVFHPEGPVALMEIRSAGPDKRYGSVDDFTALRVTRQYFRLIGAAINRAVIGYHARTGGFIRSIAELKNELWRERINLDALQDPWGQPYAFDFGVDHTRYSITVRSGGPDGKFLPGADPDAFNVWTSFIDYSGDLKRQVSKALETYLKTTSRFPQNDAELTLALKQAGDDRRQLLDPWGRPLYAVFKERSVYADRAAIINQARQGEQWSQKVEITPVTQIINFLTLRSSGLDKQEGTYDDFEVANFSRLKAEIGRDNKARALKSDVVFQGSTGAITGTLTDPNGAVVSGAKVIATNKLTSFERDVLTDDEGVYSFKNLPVGLYQIRASAPGFKDTVMTDIRVRSSSITEVNLTLEVGTVAETVTVSSSSEATTTTLSSTAQTVSGVKGIPLTQTSTPRLREYFPETLVWQPSIETDSRGRANLKFKLADNITTWKMSVVGSTEDGQLGFLEKEIRAFQPFFVEHDPPRVLTEGDEISLPVVVRNYLDRTQPVRISIKQEGWFNLLGPADQNAVVAAGDASRETFGFRATASIKEGKQRITAVAADDRDAIEKPVTVHPDGEEIATTASELILATGTVDFAISEQAIPKSAQAQLKIYPNLFGHVIESVEAIMERPYGCGEQTISSTFPSLLLLRNYKKTGQDFSLRARAERYLRAGYDRLLNYRDPSGGFTYWGRGEPDVALTAYALRFLNEAQELIDVDQGAIEQTRNWLASKQTSNGSWSVSHYGTKEEDERRTAMLTAYVARVLAATERPKNSPVTYSQRRAQVSRSLNAAIQYLSLSVEGIDEPYLLASFAIAALELGDSRADKALARLRLLAHAERDTSYWSLETNTPFYGWGLAGRVETTALVVQALIHAQSTGNQTLTPPVQSKPPHNPAPDNASQTNEQLIRGGLLFLLRQKDRYGVWYSTQATINVLDALLTSLAAAPASSDRRLLSTAEILVNGHAAHTVSLPTPNELTGPILIDVSAFLKTGTNRVEIRRRGVTTPASVQVVTTYYIPWATAKTDDAATHHASGLSLETRFDKTEGKTGDEFTCHVEAARVGFRGYGMMLAEIGLPPGADVDRASLETAMKSSDWAFSQYDVLPDRVVMYLWPRAGGVKIDFKFRPRYGLQAKTAASSLYDYYNPEARAVVEPQTFVVR